MGTLSGASGSWAGRPAETAMVAGERSRFTQPASQRRRGGPGRVAAVSVSPVPGPGAGLAPRPRVAVVFGGRSSEHAVSCVSAGCVLAALDRDVWDVVPVGITREGR